jgi:hypothetical protein
MRKRHSLIAAAMLLSATATLHGTAIAQDDGLATIIIGLDRSDAKPTAFILDRLNKKNRIKGARNAATFAHKTEEKRFYTAKVKPGDWVFRAVLRTLPLNRLRCFGDNMMQFSISEGETLYVGDLYYSAPTKRSKMILKWSGFSDNEEVLSGLADDASVPGKFDRALLTPVRFYKFQPPQMTKVNCEGRVEEFSPAEQS